MVVFYESFFSWPCSNKHGKFVTKYVFPALAFEALHNAGGAEREERGANEKIITSM